MSHDIQYTCENIVLIMMQWLFMTCRGSDTQGLVSRNLQEEVRTKPVIQTLITSKLHQ